MADQTGVAEEENLVVVVSGSRTTAAVTPRLSVSCAEGRATRYKSAGKVLIALLCRLRYEKNVAVATMSYRVYTNWYVDSGATDHIASELDKLTTHDKYPGNDQIHIR